ncbi:MAG: HlyD family efflux transporter periplasmic adaptor subunit, partial [Anaerolineae bacterium]|nr:HlyD family efflux transporter periplasmic adaptor subunit [Anaerolineae bacterium]
MKNKIWRLILSLLVAGAVGGGYWYYSQNPDALTQLQHKFGMISEAEASGMRSVSGFVEAEEFSLTAEVPGRIDQLLADEGDEVQKGDTLVILDEALAQAQLREAQAAVQIAEAALAQVKAGPRPEAIRQAEAALAQAQAARDGAYQAWQDALAIRNNPQELEAQIDATRAQLEVAEYQLQAAVAATGASQAEYDMLGRAADFVSHPQRFSVSIPTPFGTFSKSFRITFNKGEREEVFYQWNLSTRKLTSSWEAVAMAQAAHDGAQAALEDLLAIRGNPQELDTQVDVARARYERAEAAVQAAQAQLDALKTGATQEQIAVAESQVKQAQAAADLLKVQLDKMALTAPTSGLVMERTVHRGEMAVAGATLLTIADLDEVTLTTYIPEDEIGKVKVGQTVEVNVDSFPGKVFEGRVSYIASEAEFTPKNVQTK